ncbi:hypothetical protein ACP70R_024865 [Stipagrostis hirtigluma subsp. patula]
MSQSVLGHGFVVQDLTIRNTAGPENGQALALRSNSIKSVRYRVALRSNAKAVFYGCGLLVRRPVPGAHNVVTGQGCDNASRARPVRVRVPEVQGGGGAGRGPRRRRHLPGQAVEGTTPTSCSGAASCVRVDSCPWCRPAPNPRSIRTRISM